MSKIDEIMGAIGRHGDDCIRDADAASASFEALRDLIAAALVDARRDGAEAMREAAAKLARKAPLHYGSGERQAALLTDKQLDALADEVFDLIQDVPDDDVGDRTWDRMFGRAIESAVLAANNLEVRRG